jgi:uncharacterized membrane protein YebE (DUF533 family)
MTPLSRQISEWMFLETWGAPPSISDQRTEEGNLEYGKALIIAASADGTLSDAERNWILGYVAAGGHSPDTLAQLSKYKGGDDFEGLFKRGVQQIAQRVCIYDALRACGADGEVAPQELAAIKKMAVRLGLPETLVDEFKAVYDEEQKLRAKRIALVFPGGFPS